MLEVREGRGQVYLRAFVGVDVVRRVLLRETARRPGTGDAVRIYVAGYFDTRERLRPFVARLREMGNEVVSRWMDEPDGAAYATSTEAYLTDCAARDLEDIPKAQSVEDA